MSDQNRVTAALIVIGNEILSGRTKDANLSFLAEGLNEIGVVLAEARVIPDIKAKIIETVNALRAEHDYVFTTGGIGPTHDDITAPSVAAAFGRKVVRHPEAEAALRGFWEARNIEVTPARLRMAEVPEGAALVENPLSIAPGFWIENVIVMAGIPSVMQAMFGAVKGELRRGARVHSRAVSCQVPEGTIAAGLGAVQEDYPDLDIGSYPYFSEGTPGTTLVLRGTDEGQLDAALAKVEALIVDCGGKPLAAREG